MNYPILIGSQALKLHKYEVSTHDIDLFVKDSKNTDESKYDIAVIDDELYDYIIYTSTLVKFNDIDIYLPSIKVLNTIYFSSLMRIRNLDKWYDYLKKFQLTKPEDFNYDNLDCIYNLNVLRSIRISGGDTHSMKDIENSEFFKDTVPRFITHDNLHALVAKKLRGSDAVELFTNFKSDGNKVELDYNKFKSGDETIINQMIKEELIVLLIERYFLINKYCRLDQFNDINYLESQYRFIFAHFATNLCGSYIASDDFLRRYVVANAEQFIMDYFITNFELMIEITDKLYSSWLEDNYSPISLIEDTKYYPCHIDRIINDRKDNDIKKDQLRIMKLNCNYPKNYLRYNHFYFQNITEHYIDYPNINNDDFHISMKLFNNQIPILVYNCSNSSKGSIYYNYITGDTYEINEDKIVNYSKLFFEIQKDKIVFIKLYDTILKVDRFEHYYFYRSSCAYNSSTSSLLISPNYPNLDNLSLVLREFIIIIINLFTDGSMDIDHEPDSDHEGDYDELEFSTNNISRDIFNTYDPDIYYIYQDYLESNNNKFDIKYIYESIVKICKLTNDKRIYYELIEAIDAELCKVNYVYKSPEECNKLYKQYKQDIVSFVYDKLIGQKYVYYFSRSSDKIKILYDEDPYNFLEYAKFEIDINFN